MSERLCAAPLAELVDEYLRAQDRRFIESAFDQVAANASPGFFDLPNPQAMLPVSIAAAQEPPRGVARTLLECDAQCDQGAPPTFSVLSLNTPKGQANCTNAREVRGVVRDLQPRLRFPLSFFETSYKPKTPIGKIKKDTIDVSIKTLAELTNDRPIEDPFGIFMQDADLVRLSPRFMRRMFDRLRAGASVVQGSLRHARSIGKFAIQSDLGAGFPNMDRVLWVYDSAHSLARWFWEVGAVVSLRAYLAAEGMDPRDKDHELLSTLGRAQQNLGDAFSVAWARHNFSVVSPRRAYECMAYGLSPTEMWNRGDFRMTEPYRELDLRELRDIPGSWADRMIHEMMTSKKDRGGKETGEFVPIRTRIVEEMTEELVTAKGAPLDEAEQEWLMQAAVVNHSRIIRAHQWVFRQAMHVSTQLRAQAPPKPEWF